MRMRKRIGAAVLAAAIGVSSAAAPEANAQGGSTTLGALLSPLCS